MIRENVHQRFTRTAVGRRREVLEGWVHRIVPASVLHTRGMPCLMGECPHIIPFAEAMSGRLKVTGGRSVHAARTGPRGTLTACLWTAGPKDRALPPDVAVTCRACLREIERNMR